VAFVVLAASLRITLAASTPDDIPAGARELAIATLDGHWKPAVSRSPEFYGLTSAVDASNAQLAEPFVLFQLRGKSLKAYMDSSENDPRGFASMEDYCFPVEQPDGTNVGAIIIARNADENGKKWQPMKGDFVVQGFWRPRSSVLPEISEMRQTYARVYMVRYVDLGMQRYLVKDKSGRLLSGSNKASIRPLAEDASIIRDNIRSLQERTPSFGEN